MPIVRTALQQRPTAIEAAREKGRRAEERNPQFIGTGASRYGMFSTAGGDGLDYYNSWTWVCIDMIAEAISDLQSKSTRSAKKGREDVEPEHWLPTLFDNPNPEIEPVTLWSLAARWFLLNGNAYLYTPTYGEKTPQEVWVLPSNRMQVIPGGQGEPLIKGYLYYHDGGQFAIDAREMIHWKMLDPSRRSESSLYLGRSPINAAHAAITVDRANQNYLARYYENDALPAFVIVQPQAMVQHQFEEFKARWNETFMGASGAGKWAILDANKDIKPLSSTGRVEEMTALDAANMKRVCAPWGVPPLKITGEYNARATAETIEDTFQKAAVRPRAKRLAQAITRHARKWDSDKTLRFEFLPYEFNDPADKRAEKELNVRLGIKTAEEYRLEEGLEPLPPAATSNELRTTVGGATAIQALLVAYGAGQVERDAAIATAMIIYGLSGEEAGRMFPERATPKPAMEPSTDVATEPEGDGQGAALAAEKTFRAVAAVEDNLTEKALYAYWKRYDGIVEGGATALESAIAKAYRKLEREVLANLPDDSNETKADDGLSTLFDERRFTELLKELTAGPLRDLFDRVGVEVFEEARISYDDYESGYAQRINDVTVESTGKITTSVGTVKAELQKLLRETRTRPPSEVKTLIKERFTHYTEAGANRIARTTATFATGAAQKTAAATLAEDVDDIESVQRLWLPQVGGNRRAEHQSARGQAENELGLFLVGGEWVRWPGDGSAGNAINCDCVTRLRIKRKKEEG